MKNEPTHSASRRGRPEISDARRADMRERIARAAAHLFESEGFSQVSMRKIAAEVGCSPMTLYKYYDAKIDILRTLWSDVFERLFVKLTEVEEPGLEPYAQLHLLASTYLNYWLDNPTLYRLVFMAEGVTQPDVSLFVGDDDIAARYAIFAKYIVATNPESFANFDALKLRLDGLICFLHGIAHNRITISGYDWADTEALVEMALLSLSENDRL